MIKKEEVINLGIVIFFIAGFLLLVYFNVQEITGFTVKEFDGLAVDGEVDVIVTLKDNSAYSDKDTSKSQQDKFVKLNDLELNNDYDNINAIAVSINEIDLEKIIKDPNLQSITFDQTFKLLLDSSKFVIKADLVWDKLVDGIALTGSSSVCILDTGIDYNHVNLQDKTILGYDFVNNDDDPMDDHGHGTHVAGTVVSNDNNYMGIASGGNAIAVKVMNSAGNGAGADIIAGIDWCINHKDEYNISVISMSIGTDTLFEGYCDSAYQELTNIINQAVGNGIIVISAAGNNHNSVSLPLPACIINVTSVGAVDDNDNIADFSNSANILDLLGPGVSITSSYLGGNFNTLSGTSMAAPHISAGALIIKQYSDLESLGLDVFEIINVIKENGDSILDTRNSLNFPRLNIYKTLISLDVFEPKLVSWYEPTVVYDDKNVSLIASASDTFLDSVLLELGNESYLTDNYILSDLSPGENVSFRFSANDSAGNLKIANLTSFVVLDGSPVLENIDRLKALINKTFNYNVVATDPTDDSLVYNDDTDLFDINDSLISFIPSDVGNYSVNISVSDGKHIVFDDFVLEVLLNNSAPEIISHIPLNLSLDLDENESLEFSINYEDLDGGNLNINWYLDGNIVSNTDNYLFETDYSSSGNYFVSVVVSDGIDSDNLEWSLVVNNVDLVPVFVGLIENISLNENTNHNLNLSSYFIDLDGDSLSYNIGDAENISFVDDVLIPDLNFNGNLDVKFYAYDPGMNFAESNLVSLSVNNIPVCSDNFLEGEEECDGGDLNDKNCVDFDYESGSLRCGSECKFDYSDCVITSSSSGTPSGGGGTPIEREDSEVNVEEKKVEVKEIVKTSNIEEEKPFEGTGEVVKEEVKPKTSMVKAVFVKVSNFFKWIYYKVKSIF